MQKLQAIKQHSLVPRPSLAPDSGCYSMQILQAIKQYSLVPRPSLAPDSGRYSMQILQVIKQQSPVWLPCLQYANTASDQKLDGGKAWEHA